MAIPELNDKGRMAGIPLSPEAKVTVERRGEIVLIGVNRPQVCNRFDPDAFFGLAKAFLLFREVPEALLEILGHARDQFHGAFIRGKIAAFPEEQITAHSRFGLTHEGGQNLNL